MAATGDSTEKCLLIQDNNKERHQVYSSIEEGCHPATERPRKSKYFVVLCIMFMAIFERLTYYGVAINMLFYCQNVLNLAPPLPSEITLAFYGASFFMPIIAGYLADTMIGRYNTLYGCCLLNILGTSLLTATAYSYSKAYELSVSSKQGFVSLSLVLISVGAGGINVNISTLGADQVKHREPEVLEKFFNFFYFFCLIGEVLGSTVVAFVQQEVSFFCGYLMSAFSMILATVLLLMGRKHYVVYPTGDNYLVKTLRIIGKGLRNKLCCKKPLVFAHWLDGAKNTNEGDFPDKTVEDVKSLVRVIPIFLTFIFFWIIVGQMATSFALQASYLDLKVKGKLTLPATLLSTFNLFSVAAAIPVLDRVVYPGLRRLSFNFTPLRRIAVGFLLMAGSVFLAGIIEIKRKDIIKSHGTITQEVFGKRVNASTMSVFYQVPQYILSGTSMSLSLVTVSQFAYTQSPAYMRGAVLGVSMFMTGVGLNSAAALASIVKHASHGQWYPGDLNNGSLEYYMFLLAGLMLVNTAVFVCLAAKYRYANREDQLPESNLNDGSERSGS